MEQIIFDFLRLEDDIIDDLCRDVPLNNHFERYSVAKSVDYERCRMEKAVINLSQNCHDNKVLQKPVEATCSASEQDLQFSCQLNKSHYSFCAEEDALSVQTKGIKQSNFQEDYNFSPSCFENVTQIGNNYNEATSDNSKLAMSYTGKSPRQNRVLHEETTQKRLVDQDMLSNLESIAVEGRKLEVTEPMIARNMVCPDKKDPGQEQNREMKIKVNVFQDVNIPFGEDGQVDELTLHKLGTAKSKTTKIKLRVPKRIVDSENKETFNKQVVSYLSKRISSGASLNEGEVLKWTF